MIKHIFGVLGRTTKILFNTDTTLLTESYLAHLDKLELYRGRKSMIQRAKEYLSLCERFSLHQPFNPLPFTKSDKNGFPSVLSDFRPLLRGSSNQRRAALSVLRIVEDYRLPISKDISTVIKPCDYSQELMTDILNFIPKWVKELSLTLNLSDMKYHYTVKNGPNGQALLQSDYDLGAVMADEKLFGAIRTISRTLGDEFPADETFQIKSGGIHSKLTQFPEKAGKTRTIAIVDYYSQRSLNPLHKGLMKILRSLVSDGTYSHDRIGEYAKQKTLEKSSIICADLTAFTDRFPGIIQKTLLNSLLDNRRELASAFWTLLAERQFTVAWSREQVTYSCGQPMGAYASWPLASLAHHLLVEFSGQHVKDVKNRYRLIGDDVIITEALMGQNYLQNISALGVDVNYNKTVTSLEESKYSSAEVAKQLFLNGEVLTPITPGILRNLKNPWLFNTTIGVLVTRYATSKDLASLVPMLFPKETTQELVWLLLTNPINGCIKAPFGGIDTSAQLSNFLLEKARAKWDAYTDEEVRTRFKLVRLRELSSKAMKMYEEIPGTYLTAWASLSAGYLDVQSFTGGDWQHGITAVEATVLSRRWILIALFKALEELAEIDIYSDVDINNLYEVEYLPDPESPFIETKDLRNIRRSNLLRKTLESLDTEDTTTVSDGIEVPPYLSV